MKKFLLSSVVIGLIASTALANVPSPTASLGGLADFQVGSRSQKKAYKADLSNNNKNVLFNNTAKIYGKVEGKADAGFTYGAVVGLKTTAEKDRRNSNKLDKTYLYVESDAGRFELGSNYSAAKALKVDAGTFARATGGVNGDWYKYYNFTDLSNMSADQATMGAYGNSAFITSADNFTDYLNKWSEEETRKITYYSPRMSGLQLGVSYTPDASDRGANRVTSDTRYEALDALAQNLSVRDLVSGGVNYTQQMDQLLLSVSATGETGKVVRKIANNANAKNLQSYAFGANLGYANMTFGGSYGVMNKKNFASNIYSSSLDSVVDNISMINKDVKYWTAGVGYVQGPIGASVNYLQSEVKGVNSNSNFHNTLRNLVIGADYQLSAGMLPYVEVSLLDPRMKGTASPRNKGSVFLVGTQFQF